MLSIGLTEILLIAAVALLVVGPDRLPHVMREAGRWYGKLRRSADELRRAFVLEADRQDAEERYERLKERRRQAVEARKKAREEAGEGTVTQAPDLPPPDSAASAEDGNEVEEAPAPQSEEPDPPASSPMDETGGHP